MQIEMDEYLLQVEVTDYTPGDPGRTYGAWEDCYPPEPEEIEFEVTSGWRFDDDGGEFELTKEECAQVASDHCELIEEILLRDMRQEPDFDEPDFGSEAA